MLFPILEFSVVSTFVGLILLGAAKVYHAQTYGDLEAILLIQVEQSIKIASPSPFDLIISCKISSLIHLSWFIFTHLLQM